MFVLGKQEGPFHQRMCERYERAKAVYQSLCESDQELDQAFKEAQRLQDQIQKGKSKVEQRLAQMKAALQYYDRMVQLSHPAWEADPEEAILNKTD